jgi:hypothetical protein
MTQRSWLVGSVAFLANVPPLIAFGGFLCLGGASLAGNVDAGGRDAFISDRSLDLLCSRNDSTSSFTFQHIRNDLSAHKDSVADLKQLQSWLVGASHHCTREYDPTWISELLRLVASNWEDLGKLNEASGAYAASQDQIRGIPETELEEIAILQGWAEVQIQLGDLRHGKELAAEQARVAMQAYDKGKFGRDLAISALRFEISILEKAGDEASKRAVAKQMGHLADDKKYCDGLCPQ